MASAQQGTKHTSTHALRPWKVGADHFVYDAASHFVCVSGFHHTVAGGDYIPNKLNTAFIVRACNAHDQLVTALRHARERLVLANEQDIDARTLPMIDAALDAANAE